MGRLLQRQIRGVCLADAGRDGDEADREHQGHNPAEIVRTIISTRS